VVSVAGKPDRQILAAQNWGTLEGTKLLQLCVAPNAGGRLEVVALGSDRAA
jgi:hypothetical protein